MAILGGANLKWAVLDGARLAGAIYDQAMVWPDDFDPAWAGAVFEGFLAHVVRSK